MDRAHDLAGRRAGCADLLEIACLTVLLARTVADEAIGIGQRAPCLEVAVGWSQPLSARAEVTVVLGVIGKVGPREGAVAACRLNGVIFIAVSGKVKIELLPSALALLAAVLMKRASRASSTEASEGSSDLADLRRELAALAAGAEELAGHAGSLDAEAIHAELDPLIGGPAYAFVEGREILQASAGMATYALVMDPFSRGERQLARAWSASVDGHAEEARASLARAAPLLRTAAAAFPS